MDPGIEKYLLTDGTIAMFTEMNYDSDLHEKQWRLIKALLPKPKQRGRKPICRRRIINAIFYWIRTGCQWRYLPKSYPNWRTVYHVFRAWRIDGTWKAIHDRLREKVRKFSGRTPTPTAGIIDSQSIRSSEGGQERGFDAAKKITGRKRHLVVDTMGFVLVAMVKAANYQDQDMAKQIIQRVNESFYRLKRIYADSAYQRSGLPRWTWLKTLITLRVVPRKAAKKFEVLPKRWIVERTFAWLMRSRRLSRDYERLTENSEATIYISMIALMSKRIIKQNEKT